MAGLVSTPLHYQLVWMQSTPHAAWCGHCGAVLSVHGETLRCPDYDASQPMAHIGAFRPTLHEAPSWEGSTEGGHQPALPCPQCGGAGDWPPLTRQVCSVCGRRGTL